MLNYSPESMRTADQTIAPEPSTSYSVDVERQRKQEFSRVADKVYLDHAGAALYSEKQLSDVFEVRTPQQYQQVPQEFCARDKRDLLQIVRMISKIYRHSDSSDALQAFKTGVFGNPHSQHNGLLDAAATEDEARKLTLGMCNASAAEYECIFTSGATGIALAFLTFVKTLSPEDLCLCTACKSRHSLLLANVRHDNMKRCCIIQTLE